MAAHALVCLRSGHSRLGMRLGYSVVNENTYKHALRACDLLGEGGRALDILEEMRDAGVRARPPPSPPAPCRVGSATRAASTRGARRPAAE